MLAAELGNDAIVALLAHNNANLKLQDAEGKGEQKQELLFAIEHVQMVSSEEKVGKVEYYRVFALFNDVIS